MMKIFKYSEFVNENSTQIITDNINFKKWFKDSKVVDRNGNPLIVYHGSKSKDFKIFNKTKDIGYHFAVSKKIATDMAGTYSDDIFTHKIEPLAVYLSIKKMGAIPDLELWRKSDLLKVLKKENEFYNTGLTFQYNDTQSLLDNIKRFSFEYTNKYEKMDGDYKDIDGFVYYNEYEGNFTSEPKTSFIVLNSNQIKSIDNDGTFDITDDNIYS